MLQRDEKDTLPAPVLPGRDRHRNETTLPWERCEDADLPVGAPRNAQPGLGKEARADFLEEVKLKGAFKNKSQPDKEECGRLFQAEGTV